MRENTVKGLLTELQCQKDFIERKILVSQPITQDSKYDFIIDVNNKLYRIQCKTASLSDDNSYLQIKSKTTNIRTMKDSYYSKEDIDFFYTTLDGVSYLIPVEKSGHGETRLRFTSKNPKNPNIKWASNYQIDLMLQKLKEEVDN